MLPELTQDEFSLALDAVAGGVIALGDVGPPVDAVRLARALDLAVAWDAAQPGRGRIVRLRGYAGAKEQGSILVRPEPRPERLQWAVAHELGEACAFQVFDHLGVDPREAPAGAREMVANQLAGRILLPRRWFGEEGRRCGWDLLALKARFATASHELIARRMLDFAVPIAITIFDHGRRTFRRGNLPGPIRELAPLELAAWRSAHDAAKPAIEADSACRVQAWPVHEPDWKREILRTEWFGSDDM